MGAGCWSLLIVVGQLGRRDVCHGRGGAGRPLRACSGSPQSLRNVRRRQCGPSRRGIRRAGRLAPGALPSVPGLPMVTPMFTVTEAQATTIRTAFYRGGEMSAVVELRRIFPGITDNVLARECALTIAGWEPLPARPIRRRPPK
jgi:hypothetical protein